MGSCFSKKTNTTAALTPATQPSDDHPPPNDLKKELFVIKHRVSHDIDQESDKNPLSLRTPSFTNENVDSILVQCHTLSRNSSQNPSYRRRRSRSNSDCNTIADVDVDVDALDGQPQQEFRVSSSRRSNSNSKERRISISPSRRSNSKERRISISPSRRSQSPFSCKNNLNINPPPNRPAIMVSVPPTDKTSNVGPVKRIHVKRNLSPARIRVFSDDTSQDQESNSSRDAAYRRKSLVEIDNNAGRSARPRDTKRTRRLSRDLDMNPVPVSEPSPSLSSASPPSYASLLLEDIQNFHKKNTVSAATTQPAFALPECVSKACLIMEAVADMNSNTSSLCSDERWRSTTVKESSGMT